MSWFDTSGLASLAKTALKEAQKTIDKALDIKDDELVATATIIAGEGGKSKTEPTTPLQPMRLSASNPALWGSFTGSFFENPRADEMVTTPPKCGLTPSETGPGKRQSMHSNSDSVEILSTPTTPCSGMTTPSVATAQNSESVELLPTPTSSEVLSPMSAKSPDSVEVITSDEMFEEDDDSMSFSTVMDDSVAPITVVNSIPFAKGTAPHSDKQTDSCESVKTLIEGSGLTMRQASIASADDTLGDSQTVLSDSTQSFEDIQIPDTNSEDKEMVKIPSAPNSGHNSGDEIETTTSSDIEIISNPNGDSSSTNESGCRASPLKMKTISEKRETIGGLKFTKKGHCREPSEVSTQSDDSQLSNHSETDKLLRRISELSEVLEAREQRLLEIGRQNSELQEKNLQIQSLLDAKQKKSADNNETEEYTQRVSALEKKFQMSIRERDALRDQLKAARNELTTKIPKDDLDKIVSEKDFMIEELRNEGEKLSKQILNHSNIIKKLRAKEKETDSQLKRNKEQIEELTAEVERLKKSLTAKEEVERSQIEAVHKLSSEKRKLDKENQSMRSQIEDFTSKLETMQTSLEAAKKELHDKKEAHSELSRKTEALATLESEKRLTKTQNAEILGEVESLREKLKIAESGNSLREQNLRQENSDLLRRLEAAEIRAEELTHEVSLATIPLVRQLEAIQTTLNSRTSSWERQERGLVAKLEETQGKLKTLESVETDSKEQQAILNSRIKSLEERLSMALLASEQASSMLQQAEMDFGLKEGDYLGQIEKLKSNLEETMKLVDELKERCSTLEKNIEMQEDLHRKHLSQVLSSNDENCSQESNTLEIRNVVMRQDSVGDSSPTLSLGRNSLADSLASSAWQMDDLDCISNSGRQVGPGSGGSLYGLSNSFGQMGHTATIMETLQSSLKQRDGEIHQLQWELSRLQSERNVLNTEISNLTLELENMKEKMSTFETVEKEYAELQGQYDALLQMYGEKVEETQELELDLQDVKEMYKAQIDELLRQQKQV